MSEPAFSIEEVTDATEMARLRTLSEHAKRNSDWLQAHWADLLPQARGKFLAVAGQEAFLSDSAQEAWVRAKAAHPQDTGTLLQFVPSRRGPRFYANRG